MQTRTLTLADAEIAHDIHGPLPTADGREPLLVIGQPMTAEGFSELVDALEGRTIITYDPRGLGRSTRSDGSALNDPRLQAEDLHALIAELGGPVQIFASSGGAVAGLALLTAHPGDITRLVAHEPPVLSVLPDAESAARANAAVGRAYQERGWGAGMAAFIALAMWQGEFTEEFAAQPLPDPAAFGLPTEDDGTREDPLLSGASSPVTDYVSDLEALRAQREKLVLAIGAATGEALTARTTRALADALDLAPTEFPGGHGGFTTGDPTHPEDPVAFARRLEQVLDAA